MPRPDKLFRCNSLPCGWRQFASHSMIPIGSLSRNGTASARWRTSTAIAASWSHAAVIRSSSWNLLCDELAHAVRCDDAVIDGEIVWRCDAAGDDALAPAGSSGLGRSERHDRAIVQNRKARCVSRGSAARGESGGGTLREHRPTLPGAAAARAKSHNSGDTSRHTLTRWPSWLSSFGNWISGPSAARVSATR